MKWKKFRLKTLASAEDIVAEALSEALSENELKQMFVDIPLSAGQDDGTAYLDFYLDEDEDAPSILASVRERLDNLRQYTQIGACTIEEGETEDVDYIFINSRWTIS